MGEIKKTEQKPAKSNRLRLSERFKSNPGINIEDDETLWGAAADQLDEADKAAEQRKRFNEAIAKSEIAPEMMSGLLSGKNADGSPFDLEEYIFEKHQDFINDWLEDHDGAMEKLKARKAEQKKKAEEEEKWKAGIDDRIKTEDAELDEAIKESGYKPEQVKDLIDWIYDGKTGFVSRAANFELKKEDFLRLFKIKDWDVKMAESENKGYNRGRNERIDMFAHDQKRRRNLPPDQCGGGSTPSSGSNKKDATLQALEKMGSVF